MTTRLLRYGRTLLVGTVGAVVFHLLHIPLAWMLGAMTAVLLMHNFTDKEVVTHPSWRNGALLLIGYMIGSSFTAEAAAKLFVQLPSMLLTNIILVVFCLLIGWWGAKWAGMSIQSGMIGNIPGGLTQMVALSEEVDHADMTVVAMMQTIRLMAVIFIVPMLVVHGISRSMAGAEQILETAPFLILPAQAWGVLILVWLMCYVSARIAAMLHIPTPFMLGPVLITSIWGGFGMPVPPLPELFLILAQLFIGCYVGAGMKFDRQASWRRLIPLSLAAAVVVVLFSFVVGYVLTLFQPMSITTAFLSVAPGGMAEMGLTATIVGADLAVVSSYQLFRILFILFIVPPFLKWLLMKRGFGSKKQHELTPLG